MRVGIDSSAAVRASAVAAAERTRCCWPREQIAAASRSRATATGTRRVDLDAGREGGEGRHLRAPLHLLQTRCRWPDDTCMGRQGGRGAHTAALLRDLAPARPVRTLTTATGKRRSWTTCMCAGKLWSMRSSGFGEPHATSHRLMMSTTGGPLYNPSTCLHFMQRRSCRANAQCCRCTAATS